MADALATPPTLEMSLALSAFCALFDALFDGPGVPEWSGASTQLAAVSSKVHVQGFPTTRFFSEPFWGSQTQGVVAVFCETAAMRPVFMSLSAFGVPGMPADPVSAKLLALGKAQQRLVDL